LPLKDIRPGMKGVGRTVFSGNQIDEFQVDILGVLDNIGPKESLILARLSGGPLEHTGVLQGMSGSPVYIDGKLVGAVAMAFAYSKDPIAGIRPIEEMVGRGTPVSAPTTAPRRALLDNNVFRNFPKPRSVMAGESRLTDIATPVSFAGFSRDTLEAFAPQLRTLGFEPLQGVGTGARLEPGLGNPADLKPGSMISVQLMAGDLSVGADGTVTHVDGNRVYAFGHRFLGAGATALPFARSEVITLLPALNTSFKLSIAKEWMGTVSQDMDTTIYGETGKLPRLAPVNVTISREGRRIESYRMQMVDDPLLTPLLVQMAISTIIDSTERAVGAATVRLTGTAEFYNTPAPVRINTLQASENGAAILASAGAASGIAYVLQSGYKGVGLKSIDLNIDVSQTKKMLNIDGVTVSREQIKPGETVRVNVSLVGENGVEVTKYVDYHAPIGAEPGIVYFTVADASTTNVADFRQTVAATPRSIEQVVSTVNNLHPNSKAYVRVWRAVPSYQLEGSELPDPAPSAALILGGTQTNLPGISQTRNSKIGEMEIDAGDMAVAGSKTVQVEIKE
jgi:hypothetical protein